MKLLVGLGNPGEKYQGNRHNVGFMFLDYLVGEKKFKDQKKFDAKVFKKKQTIFLKPQTYMNRSGQSVVKVVNFFKIKLEDIWVVHDDLDIRLGSFKIQKGTGPKLHGGLASVEDELGKEDFWRVRVGVDNRSKARETIGETRVKWINGESYVLADFRQVEKKVVVKTFEKIKSEVEKRVLE